MSYDIIRLFALDWTATVEALRTQGDDFFWLTRTANGDDIDFSRIPFVAEFEGALASMPGWRDPTAGEIYDNLRQHLAADARERCDACFSRLFWEGNSPLTLRGLRLPEGAPPAHIWNAVSPSSVRDVLGWIQRIPWPSLHAVADRYTGWENRYLPTIDDFESQVGCHEELLREAMKRNAGVLSLISA
ncbi:MAG TPA: hypothetical protein VMZ53_00185 [Kofleriaceae bacterium]|nr:hypothetical protein [Kofleriaceae bacterium]